MRPIIFHSIFIAFLSISGLEAKDFKTLGHTFPIEEQNLKTVLERGSQKPPVKLERSNIEKTLFRKNCQLEEATSHTTFFYDPSMVLEEDIVDHEEKVLFAKGTKINPLDHVTLESGLLFFDGTNPKHVCLAQSQEGEFKWILTNGSPLKLAEEKNRPVFFDQGGLYVKKFQIKKIPCRITQVGKRLLIEEIPVKKGKK